MSAGRGWDAHYRLAQHGDEIVILDPAGSTKVGRIGEDDRLSPSTAVFLIFPSPRTPPSRHSATRKAVAIPSFQADRAPLTLTPQRLLSRDAVDGHDP